MTPQNNTFSLSDIRKTVEGFFPHLWPAVEAGLSTCATLLLADSANPVALIYVGPSSVGKTTAISMFYDATVSGQPLCYRSDKFTTAAFVSQSAKATKSELAEVDLLPRIKDKVLLTPELSTIFRGKPDDLAERFSILTRVLDGQGLTTDSGTHGKRGYEGDHLFAWLGATTPFDSAVWKVMAQLGSRMFFLAMDAVAEPTIEELVTANSQSVPYKEGRTVCRLAVHQFLEKLFTHYGGVRGVSWDTQQYPSNVLEGIAQCAMLLAIMRTPYERETQVQPESPHRANAVLYNLARGHALISGRSYLTAEDLPLIRQVTISSIPARRRAALLALAGNGGNSLTVEQVEEAAGVTRHTAEAVMQEMDWLGVAQFEQPGNGRPSILNLKPEWAWIAQGTFPIHLL